MYESEGSDRFRKSLKGQALIIDIQLIWGAAGGNPPTRWHGSGVTCGNCSRRDIGSAEGRDLGANWKFGRGFIWDCSWGKL